MSLAAEQAVSAGELQVTNGDAYILLRRASVALMNTLAIKMAGAFIFSLCVIGGHSTFSVVDTDAQRLGSHVYAASAEDNVIHPLNGTELARRAAVSS